MSDIFDAIASKPTGDIFDKVAGGDIFDSIAPSTVEPEQPAGFIDKAKAKLGSLKQDIPLNIYEHPNQFKNNGASTVARPFQAQGYRTAEAINRGLSSFSGNLDTLAQYVTKKTGLGRGGGFEKAARFYAENADYWNKKAEEVGTNAVDNLIGEAVGGAAPGIAEFMLNVPYASLLGAAEAEKQGKSELMGAIVEGAKRHILGKILHATNMLKQPYRSGAMGGVFGVQAAAEGGSPEEMAKGVGTGALYGLMGGKGQVGLKDIVKRAPKAEKSRDIFDEVEKSSPEALQQKEGTKVRAEEVKAQEPIQEKQEQGQERKKEPWEMTREEFDREALYRGVGDDNAEMENTFWSDRHGKARSFATRPTAKNGKVRIGYKKDLPELWDEDNAVKVTPDEYFKSTGEVLADLPVRAEVPADIKNVHEYLIKQALSEGKPVPPEVLKDYPDLAKIKKSAYIEPVTSRKGPGDKTTEATPQPEGGIEWLHREAIKHDSVEKFTGQYAITPPKLKPNEISEIAMNVDNRMPEESIENLKAKGVKFIDGYHVSRVGDKNDISSNGIKRGDSWYNREDSVYFFADPDDIRLAVPYLAMKIEGSDGGNVLVSQFRIPVDSIKDMSWDGFFNVQYETYSAFRIERDISANEILDTKLFAIPSAKDFKAGKKRFTQSQLADIWNKAHQNPNPSRSPEGGEQAKQSHADTNPVDAETKKYLPRQTTPLITTEQKNRIAKKKAIKEQQLQIESAEDAKKAVSSMIRERRNSLNLAAYETNLFCNEIEQVTSRQQREVIPFIIEGTDIPKGLNRPDLEKIHARDKENLSPIAKQVKRHFDDGWARMKKHAPEMSAQQIEDYVTHIWDIPRGQKRAVTSWFTTQNRFMKKRFIETINEGVEKFGLQPKVLDIAEIIRVHDSIMNRVIENNKFVENLKDLKKDGVPLIERADKAPQDWVLFDHPALRRGLVIPGEAKMGEKVSPELADLLTEMGVAIGRRISPKVFGRPNSKLGEYRHGETPEVRFQRFMSDRTIAHEIGHHIDNVLKLGDAFLEKYKTELYAINKERIASFAADPKKKAYAESSEEQIAEFFATLFTKPDKAKQFAPTATVDALERLRKDGNLTKLVDFDFEKNAKNLIEEQLNTMVKLPIKVHPDLEKPLKVIFDSRIAHPAIQAYETANGILKKANLSLSLFHHMALGETSISTMGLKKTAGIYFDPVKIYKAMVQGKYDIYEKEPIARDAIEHGLQVGATSDIPVNMIQAKLDNLARMSKGIPVAKQATEFLRTFNEKWDKALWNYLHDTLKLYAYESLAAKIDPAKNVKLQKQEVAQMVNDTFGGQNWDALMVSPKSLQLMSWSLLSPDWTLSTVRQALAPTGIGKIHKETVDIRKKMGRHFWIKAALYFGVGINLLNYTFRKQDEKEHPEYYQGQERSLVDGTMWGNTIGHKTHLFVGRYEDGTERYIRWGKQFRELPELLWDDTGFCPISAALKKVGGKLAPMIQLTSSIMTGVSPSGFRNDDTYGKAGWDRVAGIAKTLIKAPFPFSSRSLFQENKEFHLTDIAMPSSKGMTRYRSQELFKLAIVKDDERMLKEVYQETLRNNLPAYTLFGSALAQLKAESTKEFNEGLKTIADIQERIKKVSSIEDAARLKRSLKRIQKENADRKAGLKLLDVALLNVEKYKIKEKDLKQ